MGQYYRIINVDKKEAINSFDFGNGQKLMEWSYCGNKMVLAMLNLMAGAWKGDRVYVVGDYADADDLSEPWAKAYAETLKDFPNGVYNATYNEPDDATENFTYLIPEDKTIIEYREDFKNTKEVSTEDNGYRFIYNKNTKQYIDLKHCPIEWYWSWQGAEGVAKVFPLSLLLAMGNGRGGGDYWGRNKELCGTWCCDVQDIEVTKRKRKNDYEEFRPDFTEQKELIPYTEEKAFIKAERE